MSNKDNFMDKTVLICQKSRTLFRDFLLLLLIVNMICMYLHGNVYAGESPVDVRDGELSGGVN